MSDPANVKREFKGIWIPKEIWLDTHLSYFEKILWAEIDSLDGENHCFASNEYFAKFFNAKEKTISEGISRLKKLGYIYLVSFDGRTRFLSTKTTQEKFEEAASDKNRRQHPIKTGVSHIYNNIDKNIDNSLVPDSGESTTTALETSSEASKMAQYLLERRKVHFPKMLPPNLKSWIKELDLMNRKDKRSWEEIKAAIDWAMEDAFWCKNVLSADTLRKQYDKIYAKMTPVANKGSIIEINRTSAHKLLDFLISENEGNRIKIYKDYIYLPEKQEKVLFSLNPSVFEELISKLLGVKKNG